MSKTRKSGRKKSRGGFFNFGYRNYLTNRVPTKKYQNQCRANAIKAESKYGKSGVYLGLEEEKERAYHTVNDKVFDNVSLFEQACGKDGEPMVHSNQGFFYFDDEQGKLVKQ